MAAMGTMAMGHKMPPEKPTWVYPHPNDDLLYVVNNGTDNVVEVDVKKWKVNRTFKEAEESGEKSGNLLSRKLKKQTRSNQ